MEKISLSPETLAALNTESDEPLKAPPKPLSNKAIRIIRKRIVENLFGPPMRPTFKQQLLVFVSFAAVKSSWAADYWQMVYERKNGLRRGSLRMKEKYG